MSEGTEHAREPRENLGLVAKYAAKARQYQITVRTTAQRAEAAEAELKRTKDALTAAESKLAEASSSPGGKRLAELEANIRTRDYRAVFDKACRDAKVDPDAVDDLWELAKVDTSKPDIVEADIIAAVQEQRAKRPRFFATGDGQADASADLGTGTIELKPGPASGRTDSFGRGAPVVSDELLKHDPEWVMKNWDRVQADAKARVAARGR